MHCFFEATYCKFYLPGNFRPLSLCLLIRDLAIPSQVLSLSQVFELVDDNFFRKFNCIFTVCYRTTSSIWHRLPTAIMQSNLSEKRPFSLSYYTCGMWKSLTTQGAAQADPVYNPTAIVNAWSVAPVLYRTPWCLLSIPTASGTVLLKAWTASVSCRPTWWLGQRSSVCQYRCDPTATGVWFKSSWLLFDMRFLDNQLA